MSPGIYIFAYLLAVAFVPLPSITFDTRLVDMADVHAQAVVDEAAGFEDQGLARAPAQPFGAPAAAPGQSSTPTLHHAIGTGAPGAGSIVQGVGADSGGGRPSEQPRHGRDKTRIHAVGV